MLSLSPTSHYVFPACTAFSYYHFLTLLHSLTITFLLCLLVDLTLLFHLVPFSLVVLTKSLSISICCVLLTASYLLSDSIAIPCRSLLILSLLTSDHACLLAGSSALVPWLLHAIYNIPQRINDPSALAVSAL